MKKKILAIVLVATAAAVAQTAPASTPAPQGQAQAQGQAAPAQQKKEIKDPAEYNLRNVPGLVNTDGDAWEGISAYSTELHTERKSKGKSSSQ